MSQHGADEDRGSGDLPSGEAWQQLPDSFPGPTRSAAPASGAILDADPSACLLLDGPRAKVRTLDQVRKRVPHTTFCRRPEVARARSHKQPLGFKASAASFLESGRRPRPRSLTVLPGPCSADGQCTRTKGWDEKQPSACAQARFIAHIGPTTARFIDHQAGPDG